MYSKCPKCDGTSFEMVKASIENANYSYNFIQCSSCGCVVGVTESHNIGALLYKIAEKLDIDLDEE